MCGIAGIVGFCKDGVREIQNMNRCLERRGPDDGGYEIDMENRVAFGHRRLSVVDLSENGAQPMISANGRLWLVYNGETYNYREIEDRLREDGFHGRLRGCSDTEIILEAFVYYGVEKTLSLMKGMFALALYDRDNGKIYLARDRVGEKPLYYGLVKGSFAFASDLAALRAIDGFCNEIAAEVFPSYFQYGYIPAPYSIYRDIWKLEAGRFLTLDVRSLQYEVKTYWDMTQAALQGLAHPFAGTREEAAERLEALLKAVVRRQMIADVPVGAFLSGGIDSSLVVSIMQSVSSVPVKTFTIGFEEEGYNEAEYTGQIAASLGTQHTELYIGEEDAARAAKELSDCFSEPFADSSQIPTMLVSRLTREQVTVSLSGDGGDELFCGYHTYCVAEEEMEALHRRFHKLPAGINRALGRACLAVAGKNTVLYKAGSYLTMQSVEEAHRYLGSEDVRSLYLPVKRTKPLMDRYHLYQPGFLNRGGRRSVI